MKQLFAIAFAFLCSAPLAYAQNNSCPIDFANPCGATPYFSIRSQGENAAREMIGWEEFINLCNEERFYGAISITTEYTQTMRSNDISRVLFGNDISSNQCNNNCNENQPCCPAITISGSQVGQTSYGNQDAAPPRGANDWLADYFGLPMFFQSNVCFAPKIRNFVADIEMYFGLSQWADGLYARIHLPITWTKWDLNTRETIIKPGITSPFLNDHFIGYPSGYFDDQTVLPANLLSSALTFFNGSAAPAIGGGVNGGIFVQFDKLNCSKWNNCCNYSALSKTGVADLELVFGYNAVCTHNGYFGLNIRTGAPTGNHPCGEFLFEPIVGNGGHWQLGGGIDTRAVMWQGEYDNSLNFYLDANITHLFKACQRRCFDLCGKPNSRYMLAQRLTTNTNGLGGTPTAGDTNPVDVTFSDAQFANEFSPVANLTMTQVKVSAAVQGDIALKFSYDNGNGLTWDLGYNFFGRSCEKICRVRPTPLADGTSWALKGDASVYGVFINGGTGDVFTIPLAATEHCATIHSGTNNADFNAPTYRQANANIDNGQFAVFDMSGIITPLPDPFNQNQTKTSIQPIFLTEDDVDLAGTSIISNKFFTHVSYAWFEEIHWTPFIGAGISVEIAHNKTCCNNFNNTACCNSCHRTGASQWALWIKGGAAWN